jgi:hypothetical protein
VLNNRPNVMLKHKVSRTKWFFGYSFRMLLMIKRQQTEDDKFVNQPMKGG